MVNMELALVNEIFSIATIPSVIGLLMHLTLPRVNAYRLPSVFINCFKIYSSREVRRISLSELTTTPPHPMDTDMDPMITWVTLPA